MTLLHDVERFLAETGMTAREFGDNVANNINWVSRLRGGRGYKPATEIRVRAFIAGHPIPKRPWRNKITTPVNFKEMDAFYEMSKAGSDMLRDAMLRFYERRESRQRRMTSAST